MRKYFCDRCDKEQDPLGIVRIGDVRFYNSLKAGGFGVELCKKCTAAFKEWIKNEPN